MGQNAVVVTGLGVLACNGLGREAFWNAIQKGQSGVRPVDRFDASELPCRIAGQLWDFNPEDFMRKSEVRNWDRHVHQAVATAKLASEDAELASANYDSERIAVAVGTSIGSPNETYVTQSEAFASAGYRKVSKLASSAFSGHSATVHVSINLGFRGPAITISSGCATGLDVLAWGVSQIQSGRADSAVVGATESPIFPMSFASACSLGILSRRNDAPEKAMRPYDRHRDGLVLSEGAACLVLERKDYANSRGARVLAEVAGSGAAAEGVNPLILDRRGEALSRAILNAINDAGMVPEDIDHIQSHGVSLEMYDQCETSAYKAVFSDRAYRIPVSAVKSMIGQSYASGGLLSAAAAIMTLNRGFVPPTINLENPDPACDLDFVPGTGRFNDVRVALVNAISFGGTHSATVLRQAG